jgi:hypothetical protein
MKNLLLSFFALLWGTCFQVVYADTQNSPYLISVPVASQSQSDWHQGVENALQQVLIKVSGSDRIIQSGKIRNQLPQADQLVQSYTYITNPGPNGQNSTLLQVQFYPQAIKQLLQQAGAKTWNNQRPLVLILLALQTSSDRVLINNNPNEATASALQNNANRRGLPILLPMMDLQDMQTVTVDDIWQLDPNAAVIAAKRYGANNIVEAKMYADNNDQWHGQWLFLTKTQNLHGSVQGNNQNQVITKMIDQVTDSMTTQQVITEKNSNLPQQLTLHITNVNGLDDYADILKYLKSLSPVTAAEVTDISPNGLVVSVTANGGAQALDAAISAGSQMQAVIDPTTPLNNGNLTYRWVTTANTDTATTSDIKPEDTNNSVANTNVNPGP